MQRACKDLLYGWTIVARQVDGRIEQTDLQVGWLTYGQVDECTETSMCKALKDLSGWTIVAGQVDGRIEQTDHYRWAG